MNKRMINVDKYCINATIPSDRYRFVIARLFDAGMLGCEEEPALAGVKAKIYFPDRRSVREALDRIKKTDTISKIRVSYLPN
jgi:hypothetical protein